MLGLSYGEILLIIGATAALVGPKDLPIIARAGGRLFGRAIGYIQMARGHIDGVMKQPQMQEISKEVQDLRAQVDAISHGASFTLFNSNPLTRRVDNHPQESNTTANGNVIPVSVEERQKAQEFSGSSSASVNLHAQATAFERLSESVSGKTHTLNSDSGLSPVLPVSAEMAKLLPHRKESAKGSDLMLEAVLEAEVAHKAKHFFAQAEKETPALKAIFGTGMATVAASPDLRQFQIPKLGNGGGLGLVIECSSRPQKKSTAHHRKTRPKKTQPWYIKRKPTVYAPLPPLPQEWAPLALSSDEGGATAAASPAGDLVSGAAA